MASIKIYDKEQVDNLMSSKADVADLPSADELVPDTTGASEGDVLTLDANLAPVWQAGGGGSGNIESEFVNYPTSTSVAEIRDKLLNCKLGDIVIFRFIGVDTNNKNFYIRPVTVGVCAAEYTSGSRLFRLSFNESTVTISGTSSTRCSMEMIVSSTAITIKPSYQNYPTWGQSTSGEVSISTVSEAFFRIIRFS